MAGPGSRGEDTLRPGSKEWGGKWWVVASAPPLPGRSADGTTGCSVGGQPLLCLGAFRVPRKKRGWKSDGGEGLRDGCELNFLITLYSWGVGWDLNGIILGLDKET